MVDKDGICNEGQQNVEFPISVYTFVSLQMPFFFGDYDMRFDDEKELEDILVKLHKEHGNECCVTGEINNLYQQVRIPGYGVIDLLGFVADVDGPGVVSIRLKIYEIKQHKITEKDVAQIARYYSGVTRHLNNNYEMSIEHSTGTWMTRSRGSNIDVMIEVTGALIGSGIGNPSSTSYLTDAIPWLDTYIYSLGMYGLEFELMEGWHSTDEAGDRYNRKRYSFERQFIKAHGEAIAIAKIDKRLQEERTKLKVI